MLEKKNVSPLRTACGIKADQHRVSEKNEDGLITTLFPAGNGSCVGLYIILLPEKSLRPGTKCGLE